MTYKFNPTQHSTKIKAGLLKAKQAGRKLGRPKSEKIKGEDQVMSLYDYKPNTYDDIAQSVGVSRSTVQKIINKYKRK